VKRFRVIALWVVGVLAVLLVVAFVGMKLYVGGPGKSAVAAQLSESVGLPVEIESLDVGVGSSTAAFRIPDTAADPPEDILRVKSLTTDLSLAGILSGKSSPSNVTMNDVDILLRLDEKGKMLTPLPAPKPSSGGPTALPVVKVSGGRVRIRQAGRAEFVVSGVAAELKRDGDGYALSGTIDDPNWGKWAIAGRLADDPADGSVELTTPRGELKEPLLRTIPYVPQEVWDNLQASGETPAAVRFTFKPGQDLGYAVEVNPTAAADITLPAAEVTLSQVRGKVLIADGKVAVTSGSVAVAEGTIGVSGEYAFDKPTAVIALKLAADKLDLRKLPAKWGLPKEIEGKLKGSAELEVRLPPDGPPDYRGSGSGQVEGAKLAGLDAEITLRLVAADGGYRFQSGPRTQ
jgi:translocation and assembly module TamB